jgi:predicted RecA/RadA family phage recombinase
VISHQFSPDSSLQTPDCPGVAKFGIYAGARGSITISGIFCLVKDPTTNIPAGTILYWSQVSHHVIKNAYSHSMIGIAVEDAPPSSLTVNVRLFQ